ncbi:MAG: ABC transporter ATP-binding protein [Thermoanaerobaculia bacterium]
MEGERESLPPAEGRRAPLPGDPLVELRGIGKSYREGDRLHRVLHGVEARLGRGEITILLGRSGSGKSTLLNLLSGIDLPDEGDVLVDGVAINRLSETERTRYRRRHVGFVFQFFNLIPTLTVAENLLLPLELNRRSRGDRVTELLSAVGLAERAGSFPDRLSGGERQRVAIARALVHDPELILADEPTGNLDIDTGVQVLELLDRLTRQAGKTMVMATHSRRVVGVADRILRIEGGRLEEAEG